jgi:transcriptional regulator with XRE-family HTH domain
MLTHKQLRTKALANAEVATEYEKLADEFSLLDEFLKARAAQGLTQAQVAEKIGTTQSAVARMESGSGKHSPSLATLRKYADALGCKQAMSEITDIVSATAAVISTAVSVLLAFGEHGLYQPRQLMG